MGVGSHDDDPQRLPCLLPPTDSPTGWHLDAVHYLASAEPEPVAAVAPGEADAHGSGPDVSTS
jgi:hypothetical protein